MAEIDTNPAQSQRYEAFLNHFTRDRERIFAFVYSLIPRRADAEDVFQLCSLVLWRKFGEFDEAHSFLAWACGVARYEVLNYLRTACRDRLQFDDDLVGQLAQQRLQQPSLYDDHLAALRNCLKSLSDDQRGALIHAAYGSGETVKRLAERTGGAAQTLYNRLARLRRQLLACVQSKLATEG